MLFKVGVNCLGILMKYFTARFSINQIKHF